MTIHATDVSARNANQGVLHWNSSDILGPFNRLLDGGDSLIELSNDPFTKAARFAQAVAAVSQFVLAQLGDDNGSFCAAYIDRGNDIGRLTRHGYLCSFAVSLGMAALGFF
jgi:hypothetical protein